MAGILKVDKIRTPDTDSDNITLSSGGDITIAGDILTPARPAFFVRLSSASGAQSATGTIVFNEEDFDIGNNYDTSNGKFIAPIAGIYYLSFNGFGCGNSGGGSLGGGTNVYCGFHRKPSGGSSYQMGVASYFYVTNESSYPNMQLSGTYKLAVGDEITVVVTGGHVYYDADANGESSKGRFDAAFSGHFIG